MKKKLLAFTLIEVIVSIVIILILTTMAFFSFSYFTDDSYTAANKFKLQEIKNVLDSYEAINGNLPILPDPVIDGDWKVRELDNQATIYFPSVDNFPLQPSSQEPYKYYLYKNGNYYKIEGTDKSGNMTSLSNMPNSLR